MFVHVQGTTILLSISENAMCWNTKAASCFTFHFQAGLKNPKCSYWKTGPRYVITVNETETCLIFLLLGLKMEFVCFAPFAIIDSFPPH